VNILTPSAAAAHRHGTRLLCITLTRLAHCHSTNLLQGSCGTSMHHLTCELLCLLLLLTLFVMCSATACRGPRSALAVLRPGLAVSELAVSPLPGAPTAVFTLRAQPGDEQVGAAGRVVWVETCSRRACAHFLERAAVLRGSAG
jgi:hypothetical protein